MSTFTTMDEAREYVATTLGEYAADYDVEAIADAITEWSAGKLIIKPKFSDQHVFWAVAWANCK